MYLSWCLYMCGICKFEWFGNIISYIVAASRVVGIEGNKILLKNIKSEIILGDTYRQQFLLHINNKTIGK